MRKEPAPSAPCAIGTMRAATAAPLKPTKSWKLAGALGQRIGKSSWLGDRKHVSVVRGILQWRS